MAKKGTNQPAPKGTGEGRRAARRAIVFFVLLAGGTWLLGRAIAGLRAAAATLPDSSIPIGAVECTPSPAWLRMDLSGRILADFAPAGRVDLADADLSRRLAAAFDESAWVETVRVEKSFRRLHVELDYRKPELCLPWRGRYFYISGDGVVLPPDEADVEALRQALVVEGITVTEPPVVGTRLDDPRVAVVSELAGWLEPAKALMGWTAITIVDNAAGPLAGSLQTRGGSTVLWTPTGAADTPQRRLEALASVLGRFGSLDQPDGPYRYTFDVDRPEYLARTRLTGPRPLPSNH